MTAQLIDGVALSKQLRGEIAQRAAALTARGHQPGLAVILVGEDPASATYVKNKVKACADAGVHSVLEKYDATLSEADLLARLDALNADPTIHGILVQMPLPRHIDPQKVIERISTSKDVDGYSVQSAGDLMAGLPGFRPCTPYGCMKLIESTGVMKDASGATDAKSTSPHSLPSSLRLMPTSITIAPGLTMSPRSVSRRPVATTTMSAWRVCAPMSAVALWQIVTVALACSSSSAIGLPTVLLRPITTACLPLIVTPVLSISFMQP